ncbi:thioredoxin peroxidase dot5 [Pseudogymnoascus australis]
MPVVLRKRKAPVEPAPPPPSKKKTSATSAKTKAKAVPEAKAKVSKTNGAAAAAPAETVTEKVAKVTVGESIILDGFGGEVETQAGEKTTLQKLVEKSEKGVVLFTYPRASTPGCTTQVCLFRDSYAPLTATGFAIYGLSNDSPKANTTFKTKQKLPYDLLCDPQATLIEAIGFKKSPSGTLRGVFIVDKEGKVLAAQLGSPGGTHAAAKKLLGADEKAAKEEKEEKEEDVKEAEAAADVADVAEKLDANAADAEPVTN